MMKHLSFAVLALSFLLGSFPASAIFIDDYNVSNWTLETNGGTGLVDITGAPGSVYLRGSDGNEYDEFGNLPSIYTNYLVIATSTGTVTFNWDYYSADWDFPMFDPFGYFVNGDLFQLTEDYGPQPQSGTTMFDVSAGDTFGFYIWAADDSGGYADVTIDGFEAPIPEPATLALMGLGIAGLGFSKRQRQ